MNIVLQMRFIVMVFPLSIRMIPLMLRPLELENWKWKIVAAIANAVILASNFLYNVRPDAPCPKSHIAVQRDVLARTISRTLDFAERLEKPASDTWEHLLLAWVPGVERSLGPRYGDLCADKVDTLEHSDQCEVLVCLPFEHRTMATRPEAMFRRLQMARSILTVSPLENASNMSGSCATSYGLGNVGLAAAVQGGGTVLVMSKPGVGRQREVQRGQRISQRKTIGHIKFIDLSLCDAYTGCESSATPPSCN